MKLPSYEVLFDEAPTMMHVMDKDGVLLAANRQLQEQIDHDPHALIGRSADSFMAPDALAQAIADTEPISGLHSQYRRKDGSFCDVLLACRTISLAECLSGILVSAQELSAAFPTSPIRPIPNDLFDEILACLDEAVIAVEPSTGRITQWNDTAERIFGYARSETIGRDMVFLHTSPDAYERFGNDYAAAIAQRGSFQSEFHMRRHSGEVFPTEHRVHPLYKDGRLVTVLHLVRDITRRRHMEEEARQRQQQLIQADKMVSLGTLVSGIAHEINNPNSLTLLNVPILMQGWEGARPVLDEFLAENGEFLLGPLPYSEMRGHVPSLLTEMMKGAQRIKTTVDGLKDFARQVPGNAIEQVDINAVAKSAATLVSTALMRATRHFSIDYGVRLPTIAGNFQRLEQVLINLFLNACQALPDPDKAIAVTTRHDPNTQRILVEVCDEGVGIEPSDLHRLTDPFFTTKREKGGTGLGLWVSASIVRDHGGTLMFESNLNRGTRATISLPANREPGEPTA